MVLREQSICLTIALIDDRGQTDTLTLICCCLDSMGGSQSGISGVGQFCIGTDSSADYSAWWCGAGLVYFLSLN